MKYWIGLGKETCIWGTILCLLVAHYIVWSPMVFGPSLQLETEKRLGQPSWLNSPNPDQGYCIPRTIGSGTEMKTVYCRDEMQLQANILNTYVRYEDIPRMSSIHYMCLFIVGWILLKIFEQILTMRRHASAPIKWHINYR